MRFFTDVDCTEPDFVDLARRAGHYRVHAPGDADFFIVETPTLIDAGGNLVDALRPGETAGEPSPRFEFQTLPDTASIEGIGRSTTFSQVVDRVGIVDTISFGSTLDSLADGFADFLLQVGEGAVQHSSAEVHVSRVPIAVEEFLTLWAMNIDQLGLDADTKRIGEAFAAMAGEVVKARHPPREVLRTVFTWFGGKLNLFSEEFAKSAGKTLGPAAVVGAGVAAVGDWSQLASAVEKVLHALG